MPASHPFDDTYFKTAAYADVSFARFSQYWWSNRYYALLVKRFGPKGVRVLEVGCGLGHLLGWLSGSYQVYGTDINPWALQEARRNVPGGHFAHMSAENLSSFVQGSFDIVIAKHVVEHLYHPEKAIAEMSRVLSPGGILLLATPNLDSPMRRIKKENWVGYKDPTHVSLKSPAEWFSLLREHGFVVKKVFSDGFWDAPYWPVIPKIIQKLLFGAPGGLQAIMGWGIIPLHMGESMIAIVAKQDGRAKRT